MANHSTSHGPTDLSLASSTFLKNRLDLIWRTLSTNVHVSPQILMLHMERPSRELSATSWAPQHKASSWNQTNTHFNVGLMPTTWATGIATLPWKTSLPHDLDPDT